MYVCNIVCVYLDSYRHKGVIAAVMAVKQIAEKRFVGHTYTFTLPIALCLCYIPL